MCLVECEILDNMVSFERRNMGCYKHIFNQINENIDKLEPEQLSIITFNYDRSLEQSIYTGISNLYSDCKTKIGKVFRSIPIIHIHGSLGPLDWQDSFGIPYDNSFDKNRLKAMINYFNIMGESTDMLSNQYSRMEKILLAAKDIYFLGFGYHPTNLEKIGIRSVYELNTRVNLFGMCIGLTEKKRKSITQKWHIQFPPIEVNTIQFISNYVNLFE